MSQLIKRVRDRQQNEDGFTLVELLVVIVILGILASIVVFAVGGVKDKGQTSACKADKSTLQSAEEAYYASQSTAPVYGDEAVLVSGGFLAGSSDLYDVSATGGGTSYTISPVAGKGC